MAVTLCSPQSHMSESQIIQSCQGWQSSAFTKGWRNSFPPKAILIFPFPPAVTNTCSLGYQGLPGVHVTSWIKCQATVRSLLSHCYLNKCFTLRPKSNSVQCTKWVSFYRWYKRSPLPLFFFFHSEESSPLFWAIYFGGLTCYTISLQFP